ncbi:MAG: TerC/Alx family metal homeostasis membrane protein [Flavobacteriales bacterium]|nr:TerC/Alx family metal homeostasis membrane protein [Flavobacteriales bacterium]
MTDLALLLNINWGESLFFIFFLIFVLFVLLLDLGLFSKDNHEVSFRESIGWTSVWIACAIGFYFFLRFKGEMIHGVESLEGLQQLIKRYQHAITVDGLTYDELLHQYRKTISIEYLTGYFIEYALSVDNIFVMLLIFEVFHVRERYYKRVLFWGVLGAVLMRFLFIFLGATLIQHFHWILYVFGALLIYSGVRIFVKGESEDKFDEKNHPVVKLAGRIWNVYPRYIGEHFFVRKDRKFYITPLFLVLLVIEFSDLIFAIDSVPAIFVVTKDPFLVFFSNIFAIMGLRSMFFLLANVVHYFYYLKYGLGVLLTFIGCKMLFHRFMFETLGIDNVRSLYIVAGILLISILISLLFPKKKHSPAA